MGATRLEAGEDEEKIDIVQQDTVRTSTGRYEGIC